MLSYHKDVLMALSSLKRNASPLWDERTLFKAPYKPILLLCVSDGIEEGWITTNRIRLSTQLIERFETYCRAIGSPGQWDIRLPFQHLASDTGLWYPIHTNEAKLGDDLYGLMSTDSGRDFLRSVLISTYFDAATGQQLNAAHSELAVTNDVIRELITGMDNPFVLNHVNDSATRMVARPVRDQAFRIIVRRSYDYTCAVCRSRLITPSGHILVEGAHIVPRSTSHNDDPRNGIALCKTHHWLFDRHMITVRPDYRIETSPYLREQPNHVTGTLEFDGKEILLPAEKSLRPATEALLDHQLRFNSIGRAV